MMLCIALQAQAFSQESDETTAPKPNDPTTPSKRFEETMAAIQAAGQAGDVVKKLLKENESLLKRIKEAVEENAKLAEATKLANDQNQQFAATVKELLATNQQLATKVQDLEARLNDVSQIELQGLLIGEKSAVALMKIAGVIRIIKVGETLTISAGTDKTTAQTIHVKEITSEGVHIELTAPGQNGTVKKSVIIR